MQNMYVTVIFSNYRESNVITTDREWFNSKLKTFSILVIQKFVTNFTDWEEETYACKENDTTRENVFHEQNWINYFVNRGKDRIQGLVCQRVRIHNDNQDRKRTMAHGSEKAT